VLVGTLALVSGSLGFSSTTAERGVSASVVDDSEAKVGYDTGPIEITTEGGQATERVALVDVMNRFTGHDQEIEVTGVTYDIRGTNNITIDRVFEDETPPISPGNSRGIEGLVWCKEPDVTGTASLTISIEGDAVTAEISGDSTTQQREFEITCESVTPEIDVVDFGGKGKATIETASGGNGTGGAQVWVTNGEGLESVTGQFELNENLRGQLTDNVTFNGFDIVAIDLTPLDGSYVHPQWDGTGIEPGNPGGAGCYVQGAVDAGYLTDGNEKCVDD